MTQESRAVALMAPTEYISTMADAEKLYLDAALKALMEVGARDEFSSVARNFQLAYMLDQTLRDQPIGAEMEIKSEESAYQWKMQKTAFVASGEFGSPCGRLVLLASTAAPLLPFFLVLLQNPLKK